MASEPAGTPWVSMLNEPSLLRHQAHVNGCWVDASDRACFDVFNPADAQRLGGVASLSAADSAGVVAHAQRAFEKWARCLPQERSTRLRRWFESIVAHRQDLACIMTLEQGKPISEALGEIDYAASFVEFYAEEARRPNIEGVTSHLPDAEVEIWREPAGVAALITPWNFPSAMITRKAAAALAAGCSVIVHPSAETPFSALALAELATRAGLPAGLFNVVTGDAETVVTPWLRDTRVRVVSFTGSTPVGKLLYERSASTVKRLILELGGHAPFIVFGDANLEQAVNEAMQAKFATSGQDCLGANRFLVEHTVYEHFCELFTARTRALSVGAGMDDPDIGPLMNRKAIAKQAEHVADALARGARLLAGGKVHAAGELFFEPTVLADVPADARIMNEETFGPVAAIARFEDEHQALAWANATEYALVAYLHTNDPRRIYRLSRELQFGMVAVNRTQVTGAPIPFGGMKQSGIEREGARLGMEAFTEIKYVCRDWA